MVKWPSGSETQKLVVINWVDGVNYPPEKDSEVEFTLSKENQVILVRVALQLSGIAELRYRWEHGKMNNTNKYGHD